MHTSFTVLLLYCFFLCGQPSMPTDGRSFHSFLLLLPNSVSLRLLPVTNDVNQNTSIKEWEGTAEADVASLTPGTGAVTWWYQVIFFQHS